MRRGRHKHSTELYLDFFSILPDFQCNILMFYRCWGKFLTQLWRIRAFSKRLAGQTGAFISCQNVFVMLGPVPQAQLHTNKKFDFCLSKCLTITWIISTFFLFSISDPDWPICNTISACNKLILLCVQFYENWNYILVSVWTLFSVPTTPLSFLYEIHKWKTVFNCH